METGRRGSFTGAATAADATRLLLGMKQADQMTVITTCSGIQRGRKNGRRQCRRRRRSTVVRPVRLSGQRRLRLGSQVS